MQIGSGPSPLSLAVLKALAAQPAGAAQVAAKAQPAAPAQTARPVPGGEASEALSEQRKPPRGSFVDLRA